MSVVLIIDDDEALCRSLVILLEAEGHEARYATTARDGLVAFSEWPPDLVLLDLKLPDRSGMEVLGDVIDAQQDVPVVMITGQQDMKTTIEAMRSGAFDYIRKPFEFDDVLLLLEKVNRFSTRRRQSGPDVSVEPVSEAPYEIIGADKKIVEVVKQIGLLSRNRITVLIEGESGTGKELVARALHETASPGRPFVGINCTAVVPTLLESELFGHERGAFTGAESRKIGKLEYAGEGTVFLDEIGDMPPDLQAKIVRVLQEREFERVGSLESVPFKARVIAATHRDLPALIEEGRFREDLYYRLAVARIVLPPLRERRGDIRMLVNYLLGRIGHQLHREVSAISEEAMRRLEGYDWPGNIRELENVLTRAIALARGPVLSADDLEFSLGRPMDEAPAASEIVPLQQSEREYIERALTAMGWNVAQTARALRISPTTLRKKIADYGLRRPT